MKLIVGLGNVDRKYHGNRHNVGRRTIDLLASQINKEWKPDAKFSASTIIGSNYILVQPNCFMNESGLVIAKLFNFYKVNPNDMYIVFDDLDIKIGEFKTQLGKGPRDHNGLNSIYAKIGTKDFWHIRIGIENRQNSGTHLSGEDYVLQDFTVDERATVDTAIKEVVSTLLKDVIKQPDK